MEKRHRIFIAINLPADIRKVLFAYSEKYAELFRSLGDQESATKSGPVKWTIKENLHITLEFLGNLTDAEIGEVCGAVKEVANYHESFSINLKRILYGPPQKFPPKMVWVEGGKSKELAEIRKNLEQSLAQIVAFTPENRAFAPHITLARISAWGWRRIEPEEMPEINKDIDLVFTVDSIEVMESELRRPGPRYTILESCQFKDQEL